MREENFAHELGMRRGHAGACRAAGGGGWAPQELGAGRSPRPICTQWDGLEFVGVWPSGSEALTPGRQGGWTQRQEKTLCRETSGAELSNKTFCSDGQALYPPWPIW